MKKYANLENAGDISVYLAAGWFTQSQMATMTKLYNFLKDCGFVVLSPYYNGIVVNKENDSPEIRDSAYNWNLDSICDSDLVIAVIDDYDPGTMFEIGYATKSGEVDELNGLPNIISYSDVEGRGLNLMLQKSSYAFANGIDQLYEQLRLYILGEPAVDNLPYVKGDVI